MINVQENETMYTQGAIPVVGNFEKVSFATFEKSLIDLGLSNRKEEDFAIWESITLPTRATAGSAGYDFYSPIDILLRGSIDSVTVPTGIRTRMQPGWVLMIYPRSGLGFKFRFGLDNCTGIIDGDYYHADNEGHIMLKCHAGINVARKIVDKGDRFAQGIFLPFGITSDDDATAARTGGMGSTGTK